MVASHCSYHSFFLVGQMDGGRRRKNVNTGYKYNKFVLFQNGA